MGPKQTGTAGAPEDTRKRSGGDASLMSSPLKRVKAAIRQRAAEQAAREELVLSTVDGFRAHVTTELKESVRPHVDVIVTGTLIWKSYHECGSKSFVRLHMTDAEPADTLEELNEFETLYNSSPANAALVDSVLLTATVFGETLDSPNLPNNGSLIRIVNARKRELYLGKACQLIARAGDITTMSTP